MSRAVALGVVCVVLAGVSGCGGPDVAARELLLAVNAYAETIEKKDSPERQRDAFDRGRTALSKFQKMSTDEQERMTKKYESDFKRARDRFEAAKRAQVLEGGGEPLDILEGAFK